MLWGRVHVQMLPHSSACTYINDQESRELTQGLSYRSSFGSSCTNIELLGLDDTIF
jgi:hypothetical protein